MKCVSRWTMIAGLFLAGCGGQTTSPNPDVTPAPQGGGRTVPVAVKSGKVELSPENTKIEFIGTHVAANPDPRTGGFAKFSGKAELDADGKTLKSVSVDIDTSSLWTEFDKLTTHLNSPDFFDTRAHPTAKFASTKVTASGGENRYEITGNLTLLGNTKEVSFPATVKVGDGGLTLSGSLTIDRTQFGMDKLQDKVEKTVTLNVAIGEKTQPKKSS